MEKKQLELGERGLSIILIVFSMFAIYESYKICGTKLTTSSPGAFPVFISSMLLIFSIWIWLEKSNSIQHKNQNILDRIKAIRNLILTRETFLMIILIILYAVMIDLIGFAISTLIFLWISISFLSAGKLLRNLGISILIVAIILLIFKTIFKVILP